MTTQSRSREAEAFLAALHDTAPNAVSACDGWTTHEITAHLAAAAAEVTRHLEPYLAGDEVPETQSFEVREAPYRAFDDAALRARLEIEEAAARGLVEEVLAGDPDAVIPWTGRQMPVAKFVPHMRSEFALHRWDIAGDDEVSADLLGQFDLTEHAVTVLGTVLVARGSEHDPGSGSEFSAVLRTAGAPDVCLVVGDRRAGLEIADTRGTAAAVELDAAARLLVIWGRHPGQPGRFSSALTTESLARLQALLSGY